MAEKQDGEDAEGKTEDSSSEDYEDYPCPSNYHEAKRQRPVAGSRIEEMSKPHKRRLLALYEQYGCFFPPQKLMRVKQMIEEMFCMSPEQTEQYFQEIREEAERRRKLRKQRRKEHMKHKKLKMEEKRAKVRLKVICILRDCMMKAYNTPMKILMSERLRQVSDVCLCQLCDILHKKVPDRDSQDKVSRLLIAFADWMAYWIETIAYDIEADKAQLSESQSTVKEVQHGAPQVEDDIPNQT